MQLLYKYSPALFAIGAAFAFNLIGFDIYTDREFADIPKAISFVLVTVLSLLCGAAMHDLWPEEKK